MTPAIKISKVSKSFELPHDRTNTLKGSLLRLAKLKKNPVTTQRVLNKISLEVRKGEFFGVLGRNGSGKSTLLKILAEIYQPTNGEIRIEGRLVPFIELGVGFNNELSGRDNIYLNGALLGFSKTEITKMYRQIVEFAELEKFMDQKLKNYSSGMQVRLAFSIATRANADILLVDEVLAVGDADFQRKCYDYFRQLKRQQTTVVFVTHDMQAVRQYCDRAILIENQKIIADDQAHRVASLYSQLFTDQTSKDVKDQPAGTRWGDGSFSYQKVEVKSDPDKIEIIAAGKTTQNLDDLVLGFSVRNFDGQPILGTNSQIKGHDFKRLKSDETLKVKWRFKNILADGKHFVDVTAHSRDEVPVYDWWEGAILLTVKKAERTAYYINPTIELDSQ